MVLYNTLEMKKELLNGAQARYIVVHFVIDQPLIP